MTDGERLEDIVETAVARGDAPGVVAAVGRGDEAHIAAAGVMAVGGPAIQPGTLFRISSITKPVTAAVVLSLADDGEMTRDQLTPAQRARVWPGFSFLDDRGWGYGVSVTDWGYTWEGGLGTAWSNVPAQDLTVVVLTQRAADETGMPAVCEEVRTATSSW